MPKTFSPLVRINCSFCSCRRQRKDLSWTLGLAQKMQWKKGDHKHMDLCPKRRVWKGLQTCRSATITFQCCVSQVLFVSKLKMFRRLLRIKSLFGCFSSDLFLHQVSHHTKEGVDAAHKSLARPGSRRREFRCHHVSLKPRNWPWPILFASKLRHIFKEMIKSSKGSVN